MPEQTQPSHPAVDDLLDAYERRPVASADSASLNHRYWALVMGRLARTLSWSDRSIVHWARARLDLALGCARRRELALARQYLQEVRAAKPAAAPLIQALVSSACDSAEAYLHYQRGDFPSSLSALDRAETADRSIEMTSQLPEWRLHKATLASNRAHVYARQGDFVAGVGHLAGAIAEFVSDSALLRNADENGESAGVFFDELLNELVWSFVGETAILFANAEHTDLARAGEAIRPLTPSADCGNGYLPIARLFSSLNALAAAGNRSIAEWVELFTLLPPHSAQTWQAVCGLLVLYGDRATEPLQRRIVEDMAGARHSYGCFGNRLITRIQVAASQRGIAASVGRLLQP